MQIKYLRYSHVCGQSTPLRFDERVQKLEDAAREAVKQRSSQRKEIEPVITEHMQAPRPKFKHVLGEISVMR